MHGQPSLPAAIRHRWGIADLPSKGPKPRVTVSNIVTTAVAAADAQSLGHVTLAEVAKAVGLTTTALYRYVDSKETLVELMIDAALGEPPRAIAAEPRQGLRTWASSLQDRYRAHPWLATVPPQRAPRCPNSFAWLEAAVTCCVALKIDHPVATAIAADVMIRGYVALAHASHDAAPDEELGSLIVQRYPGLSETVASDPEAELAVMLDRLLQA